MKVTHFSIQFDNERAVFNVGEEIKGKVVLHLSKPMKMRRIRIFFEGKGKAYWDVRNGKHTTKYRGHETYLSHTLMLYGSGQQDESSIEHPAGQFMYPFAVSTPYTLPSSFEGRRGYVRYTCKAVIDRPWKFDEGIKRAFTIIHHVDLNRIPEAVIPVIAETEETIQGCCCEEGRVKLQLELNKTGYVPGEHLVYDIKVENNSSNTISEVGLELKQTTTYVGQSDSLFSSGKPHYHDKTDTFSLLNENFQIQQNTTKSISRASIVPSLPPSQLEGCNIINIAYSVVLRVPCSWSTIKIQRPVLIGTIPAQSMPVARPQPSEPSAPGIEFSVIGPDLSLQPPAYSHDAPPPSYAECVFGRVAIRDENDDEHTGGENSWAPAYPYYDWSQHGNQTYGGARPTVPQYAPPAYDD